MHLPDRRGLDYCCHGLGRGRYRPMKFTRSPAMALLVLGGLFMFIDTLLSWQAVTVGHLTYSRNAWHGFWGVILGLMSIAFLLSASVHGGIVELRFRLPHRLIAIVLAPVMFVFAVIKTITDDNSAWAAYVGIALTAVLVLAAFLTWNEKEPVREAPAQT
jgi:hypothetical protein